MVAALWWLFTLILVSSYTANLAAFLTMKRLELPIRNVEDLMSQSSIKYGGLKQPILLSFLENSQNPTYQLLSQKLKSDEDNFATAEEGLKRVIEGEGNYAFLMQTTAIEFMVNRNCNLTQIGSTLNNEYYAFPLPKGSPYLAQMNKAILELHNNGRMQTLKKRWWQDMYNNGTTCSSGSDDGESLGIAVMSGPFVILAVGLFISLFISCVERRCLIFRSGKE